MIQSTIAKGTRTEAMNGMDPYREAVGPNVVKEMRKFSRLLWENCRAAPIYAISGSMKTGVTKKGLHPVIEFQA